MNIIRAKFIYINGEYKKDLAVAYNNKIVKVARFENLKKEYKNAQVIEYEGNSILYPGFINPHVHLEFSANRATLELGDFLTWLYSVIEYRDELVSKVNNDLIEFAIKDMLKSGVTTFGEISSFGASLEACVSTPARVIYFNEAIGSNPAIIDALFSDFKQRLYGSLKYKNERFFPAVAIHSPYSVHPFLLREVLQIAKEEELLLSTHFLESKAEREWLEENRGEFLEFFMKYFKTNKAVHSIEEFLKAFDTIPTLFTHCTQANKKELEYIQEKGHFITHCPRSNRLLNSGKLDIKSVKNLTLATDGLSSNYSLSILEELKAALIMHTDINPKILALILIEAVTTNAAKALNLPIGAIKEGNFADFAIFELPADLKHEDNGSLALFSITHTTKAKAVYINGEKVI